MVLQLVITTPRALAVLVLTGKALQERRVRAQALPVLVAKLAAGH